VNTKTTSTPSSEASGLTFDFAHLYHLLLSKAWVIILLVILSLGAAIGYICWAKKIYASRAVIAVEQGAPKGNNIQDFNSDNTDQKTADVLKTIEQALLSETLFLQVVKANGLDKDPEFAPPKKDGSAYTDTELVGLFSSKVDVKLRKGTRLIDVSVEDPDPKRAQQLAESMVK